MQDVQSIFSTIMFTDVVGSSKLWNEYPSDNVLNALIDHEGRMKHFVENSCRGIVTRMIGDAFMCEFPEPRGIENAISCAVSIQKDLYDNPVVISSEDEHGESAKLQIRIGIAHGRMFKRPITLQGCTSYDYFGDAVNIASRMESKVCKPGQAAWTIVDEDGNGGEIEADQLSDREKNILKRYVERRDLETKIRFYSRFTDTTCPPIPHEKLENDENNSMLTINRRRRSSRILKTAEIVYDCNFIQDLKIGNRDHLRAYTFNILAKQLFSELSYLSSRKEMEQ